MAAGVLIIIVPGMFRNTGNLGIPLMLFGLGVRLSMDRIEQLGPALRINALYLLAGLLTLPVVLWLLPLTPEWSRLVTLFVMLPPAVLNYLLCEQYRVAPRTVASVVLLGNVLVPRLPTAVLVTGISVVSLLMFVSGIILDSLTRARRETRRFAYLSIPLHKPQDLDV